MSSSSSSPHRKGTINDVTVKKENNKVTVLPQALDIIWGADSRYWRIPKEGEIELLQVCWLEVSGSIDLEKLDKGKEYTINFKVKMKPDAFGWTDSPVYLMAKPGKGAKHIWKKTDLSSKKAGEDVEVPGNLKFTIPNSQDTAGDKLLFGMYEIWKGKWKAGLQIYAVSIAPVA